MEIHAKSQLILTRSKSCTNASSISTDIELTYKATFSPAVAKCFFMAVFTIISQVLLSFSITASTVLKSGLLSSSQVAQV